jgi:hypothetical protein
VKLYCECGAKLRWGTNKSGKRQPFNFEPDVKGNRVLDEFANVHNHTPGERVPPGFTGPFVPHHATCARVQKFRR